MSQNIGLKDLELHTEGIASGMTIQDISNISDQYGLELSAEQLKLLVHYGELLKGWNDKVNLISRKDEENILFKHILHSLLVAMPAVANYEIRQHSKVLDLGTGGGLPGIPVKIARPDLSITLCDSIGKKIAACQDMISQLGLKNIEAIVSRTEELPKQAEYKAAFDVIISRAVAPLDDLAKWLKDLVKPGATLLTLKGGDLSEEIKRAERLKYVKAIENRLIALEGFREEEKRIVRLDFI